MPSQDYQKTLREIIPVENLPEKYGGKSKLDPDCLVRIAEL